MKISEEQRPQALVMVIEGRLDSNNSTALEEVLPERARSHPALVVDMTAVPYVSSAGLRVLLKGAKSAKASGHRLALAGLSESVREVFDISGFSSIFTLEPDVEAALNAVA